MVTAVVFDFDGLVLDTETPIFRSWAEAYDACGVAPLTLDEWVAAIGTVGGFDPLAELSVRVAAATGAPGGAGRHVALEEVLSRRKERRDALLATEVIRPGVLDWLAAAHRLGLGIGLASSSTRGWVEGHLRRLGVFEEFDAAVCFGDDAAPGGTADQAGDDDQHVVAPHDGGASAPGVVPGDAGQRAHPAGRLRAKPAPDLYLAVCEVLGAPPRAAVAIEDSPNGIQAALAAGMYCVAVPNAMTRQLNLGDAHLVVDSLVDISLPEALEALESGAGGA